MPYAAIYMPFITPMPPVDYAFIFRARYVITICHLLRAFDALFRQLYAFAMLRYTYCLRAAQRAKARMMRIRQRLPDELWPLMLMLRC